MADKSILEMVKAEADKALRESVKASVRKLYEERQRAVEVINGIEDKIVIELSRLGEDPDAIRAMLAD